MSEQLVPLHEAQAWVLEACTPLPAVRLPLAEAVGCVLAEPVVSAEAVPPFANTAVDGFAVQAADTAGAPVELDVAGFLPAGRAPDVPVEPGRAVRIMTGAPVPEGADAVVMVEHTEPAAEGRVRVLAPVRPGENVRAAAEDVAPGQRVFAAGTEVTPALVGVLASLGLPDAPVVRRARVGVLSTGDELVEGAGALSPGQIRESNRPALLASCRAAGFEAVDLGLVPDDEAAITDALHRGVAGCDAVLTSGGVSMGDVDLVKVVLDRLSGGSFRWMQVAIKPAKPFAFGVIDGTPVFGLPGNPVSSLVSYECFARPGTRRRMGYAGRGLWRPTVRAAAAEPLRRRADGKLHLVRVAVEGDEHGRLRVRPSGGQGSNILTAMAVAQALALLPDGDGAEPGDEVVLWML